MNFLEGLIRALIIVAAIFFMVAPFAEKFATYRRDKEKKISYKRLRIVLYSLVYIVAVTVALCFLQDLLQWLENLAVVQWLVNLFAVASRVVYCSKVIVAVLVNALIGFVYGVFGKFVRIGLKKKNLTVPKKKNGQWNWRQKLERKIIKFFHTETWFFVGRILRWLSITLSCVYLLLFVAYLIPAVYTANWIPYDLISTIFSAGYMYPTITLLGLWEACFFLQGIERLEEECPELLREEGENLSVTQTDLQVIDREVKTQFRDYYVCDLELPEKIEGIASANHHAITELIAGAVENDKRNPQVRKETYLNCIDQMLDTDKSVLINGSLFSEFSMYFLRLLSVTVARGDNVVFVCNDDGQIDTVYQYLKEGLSELTSLYCKDFGQDRVDFDDPVWRIVKISENGDELAEASVDDNSILVTSLEYLCSSRFENHHKAFIHLLDTVVFVDTRKTVNTYNRRLAMFNTRLKHIAKSNALLSKNGAVNAEFRVRYMSRQVRYICFDDTRTFGLDKVLKNLLSVPFVTVDAMRYPQKTLVRCYRYEGMPNEEGRQVCPQFFPTEEEVGVLMNMAVLCLAKGATNVTVFAQEAIPYGNIAETIAANLGQVSIQADGNNLRLNRPFYNPDDYSVVIAMDTGDNLPSALRKYMAMLSEKPALLMILSRPYMLRDYYTQHIQQLWHTVQLERIPVVESTSANVAQSILLKANAGGILEREILDLAAQEPQFAGYVKNKDISGILKAVLQQQGENSDLLQHFEFVSVQDFDEKGIYRAEDRVLLKRHSNLSDRIGGRDMAVLSTMEQQLPLPVPRHRLTQNYIPGQNLLLGGNIYYISSVDTVHGKVYGKLAVGGKNDEAYTYLQDREYHLQLQEDSVQRLFPTKHMRLDRKQEDIRVDDVILSVLRVPMEVVTNGYYEINPHSLSGNAGFDVYHCIREEGNDLLAKQCYRRYGNLTQPVWSSDAILKDTELLSWQQGATVMVIRLTGAFGADSDKTAALAAAMLQEVLHNMFPSVADAVAVCPVRRGEMTEEAKKVLQRQPKLRLSGENAYITGQGLELVVIEDSSQDLGVISVLMSAGDDLLNTLFAPLYAYLKWQNTAPQKNRYLYYGQEKAPECFDFDSLYKLSGLLGDDKHDLKFVDIDELIEYDVCDFCGRRYAKGESMVVLDDGRKMCVSCGENLVSSNKRILKAHLERARIFLESTYGITLDTDYDFCFENTVKVINTLKQNRDLLGRGSDAPLKSFIEGKKVHVESSIPSVNLSELLVRELTHVWQLKNIPNLTEGMAEGHIALVGIQYLRFLNAHTLAAARTAYYESNGHISGEGYRKLVRELLANPQFGNNPFRYLLETNGLWEEDQAAPVVPIVTDGDFGKPYTPQTPDRALDGKIAYFYYDRLTATQQRAYDIWLAAVQKHEKYITVECSYDDMYTVSMSIHYDHPELFWYKHYNYAGSQVELLYGASAEETAVLQKRIDEAVKPYLEGIDDSMSAYDVALRLHLKVIACVDYDTIALEQQEKEGGPARDKIDYLRTICGVFLNKKAVCEGYARAMQYLLQKCGVECAEAVGYIRKENGERDGAHAWNILKVDSDYYYLDTTWDDRSNTVQTVKSKDFGFDYFCITTEELTRTRDTSLCPAYVPECVATRCNYFTHNGLVLEEYDLSRIKQIAQEKAKAGKPNFTVKCSSKALYEQVFNQLCAVGKDCYDVLKSAAKQDRKIRTDTYSYVYDNNIRTITVKFKYKE